MEQITLYILETFVNITATVVITVMALILGGKILNEKRNTGEFNVFRILVLGVYVSMSWLLIWELLYKSTPLQFIFSEEFTISKQTFSMYYFGAGLLITFSLSMVAYVNGLKSLYYTPMFIYGGMVITFLLTGFSEFLTPYIYGGASISVAFLYYTGFKLKDNGALGLAIMSSSAFAALIFGNNLLGLALNLAYPIFGIFYATGHFNPFKNDEEKTNNE